MAVSIKSFTILIALLFSFTAPVIAQTKKQDSIRRLARADVKKFELDKSDLKIFRANRNNGTSDLFKPTVANTNHIELLTDSTYVKYFRERTYQKTMHKHTVGHYFLIGGISVLSAATIIIVALSG